MANAGSLSKEKYLLGDTRPGFELAVAARFFFVVFRSLPFAV